MAQRKKAIQTNLIMGYFKKNPNREIAHPEIVDWAVAEYKKRTKQVFRDPDRAIRMLSQQGYLIKVHKGVYRYDPEYVKVRKFEGFTPEQREKIFERDHYRCVICGLGRGDGVEIHADHIKPRDLGGVSEIENGQTLCAPHNFKKKNYRQTETGKKMFIRLYALAKKINDSEMKKFCCEVLELYEKNNINGHIIWEK